MFNDRRISTNDSKLPQWGPDGRELFYQSPDGKIMAVSVRLGADSIDASAPRELGVQIGKIEGRRPGPMLRDLTMAYRKRHGFADVRGRLDDGPDGSPPATAPAA